ncbi:MAG: hypothetical protein AAFQ98_07505 [Bacteroidota bacterium]
MLRLLLFTLIISLVVVWVCQPTAKDSPGQATDSPQGLAGNFDSLVWADEFNGNGPIDTTRWFQQTQ